MEERQWVNLRCEYKIRNIDWKIKKQINLQTAEAKRKCPDLSRGPEEDNETVGSDYTA